MQKAFYLMHKRSKVILKIIEKVNDYVFGDCSRCKKVLSDPILICKVCTEHITRNVFRLWENVTPRSGSIKVLIIKEEKLKREQGLEIEKKSKSFR